MKTEATTSCAACGMACRPGEYHPWLACLLKTSGYTSDQIKVNLRAVVDYGMRAQASGVSLDGAMNNFYRVK